MEDTPSPPRIGTEDVHLDYHARQYREPYRSTVAFADWLEHMGLLHPKTATRLLDVGCGGGANVWYLAKRFPGCELLGIDIDAPLVAWGNERLREHGVGNGRLEVGDLSNLGQTSGVGPDGVLSFQLLSWLPEYERPLRDILALRPRFLALTSLFFEGDIDCRVEVHDYTLAPPGAESRRSLYNIYPLPRVQKLLSELGYSDFRWKPFAIDVDLPRPSRLGMGTYTEALVDGRRLQISGPLLMSWYFICACRTDEQ